MLPLSMAGVGQINVIKKVGGSPETRRFLENLGFTQGTAVVVLNKIGDNVIVKIKDSRVAVSSQMVTKILI